MFLRQFTVVTTLTILQTCFERGSSPALPASVIASDTGRGLAKAATGRTKARAQESFMIAVLARARKVGDVLGECCL